MFTVARNWAIHPVLDLGSLFVQLWSCVLKLKLSVWTEIVWVMVSPCFTLQCGCSQGLSSGAGWSNNI